MLLCCQGAHKVPTLLPGVRWIYRHAYHCARENQQKESKPSIERIIASNVIKLLELKYKVPHSPGTAQ